MNEHYPFVLENLSYPYNALEPFIDSQTMYLHHDKHLAAYVNNLNNLLKDRPAYQSWSLEDLIINNHYLPADIRRDVINNAGGVYNHDLFFHSMGHMDTECDLTPIQTALEHNFNSLDEFKKQFSQSAMKQFGSGYAWLVITPGEQLFIVNTDNQFTPLPFALYPLLLIDVWEHAYYLKYKNERDRYIDNWFSTINWCRVNNRYLNYINSPGLAMQQYRS